VVALQIASQDGAERAELAQTLQEGLLPPRLPEIPASRSRRGMWAVVSCPNPPLGLASSAAAGAAHLSPRRLGGDQRAGVGEQHGRAAAARLLWVSSAARSLDCLHLASLADLGQPGDDAVAAVFG
jgi:hypothetical protein